MTAPRQETNIRLTDIVIDKVLSRLGVSGTDLADDFVNKLNQILGQPIEITPSDPSSLILNVGSGIYSLPDGMRIAMYSDAIMSVLLSGTIDFGTGTISTGGVVTFADQLPSMVAGNYVKALIQYEIDSNSLYVTFGTQNAVLNNATVPNVSDGFLAICLVELHSTAGGVGVFDVITKANLIKLMGTSSADVVIGSSAPREEIQNVVGAPATVFNLVNLTIPANRLKLKVYWNGVKQSNAVDYNVTADKIVTFVSPMPIGAEITFRLE